jgi:hypothetical protein
MICKICNSKTQQVFKSKILKKYNVNYFKCSNCGYLFTEEPSWLQEAYSRSINLSDTGILQRNIYFSKILSILIYFNFNKDALFLDYAGGYGIFTRLMRDIGFDFYWHDPFSQNLLAHGFEVDLNLKSKFELITAFEVFEHLVNPIHEINKMLNLSESIIFSTELVPVEVPDPAKWWYYGFNHGQHVAFYSKKTLITIANHFNLKYYAFDGIYLLSKHKIKLSKIYLSKFNKFGLSYFVKKNMRSRIVSDFELLKTKENQE